MANASRDQNFVPTLLAVSSADGTTPVPVYADPTTHRLLTDSSGSTELQLEDALAADGDYTGITMPGVAGTTLAFGDLVYLASADSRWELVDADSSATCGGVLTGMCVQAAAADGSATTILLQGTVRADAVFPALTIGAPVYASTTAGDVQTTQPSGTDDVIQVVGFGLTADSMYFNPSNDYVTHA